MAYDKIVNIPATLSVDVPRPPLVGEPAVITTTTTTTTTSYPAGSHSIMPASGYWGTNWPAIGAIPQSLSVGGWTVSEGGFRGFKQQTFLGASIRSFSMNGGFGDSSSTLSVELINDEYNVSDKNGKGGGDDVYHNGIHDLFAPPMVGSPVFFKYGQNFATVEEAYRQTFDDTYYITTINDISATQAGTYNRDAFTTLPDESYVYMDAAIGTSTNTASTGVLDTTFTAPIIDFKTFNASPGRGKYHLVFGGILQTYTQNRGPGGNPLYAVQVIDPREILSNVVVILNSYTGTVYNTTNMYNVYGFLEHNLSATGLAAVSGAYATNRPLTRKVDLESVDIEKSMIVFTGDDTYRSQEWDDFLKLPPLEKPKPTDDAMTVKQKVTEIITRETQKQTILNTKKAFFPITGTGYSRRGSQGIPFYRVKQAMNALMESYCPLDKEYIDRNFGNRINFRGFNYIVDFSGLPDVPDLYYLDFDQINLLDLALEICDVTSQDLFVTLLPVIKHPACQYIYDWNIAHQGIGLNDNKKDMIAGIIRLDAIDRSQPPKYGAIKKYIDGLASSGIYVENQDLGFELSNVVTDKFVSGAQEVDIHYFSTNNDRETLVDKAKKLAEKITQSPASLKAGYKWTLDCSLAQQMLPYYGMLGNNAVTIPKGFGAYQQILLDASSLTANGVGQYYVATELELRCAMISYDRWVEFLSLYNDKYVESIESNDAEEIAFLGSNRPAGGGVDPPTFTVSNNYAVTVPRSVFTTYTPVGSEFNKDNLPYSPCNPPYGYPLYYKRMTKIGIPEGGLTNIITRWTTVLTNYAELQSTDINNFKAVIGSQLEQLRQLEEDAPLSEFEKTYYDELEKLMQKKNPVPGDILATVALIQPLIDSQNKTFAILPQIAKQNKDNAMKVYDFLKNIADECLGKKFLVKLPNKVNLSYDKKITWKNEKVGEYDEGPFGFRPRPLTSGVGDEFKTEFKDKYKSLKPKFNTMEAFLALVKDEKGVIEPPPPYAGACYVNFNPISEQYESNYVPTDHGGFFDFDLYANVINHKDMQIIKGRGYKEMPLGVQQMLVPQDLGNFIDENGRVSPYVRFDHSQDLTLETLSKSDFSQQTLTADGMITDFSYDLDNTKGDKFHAFPPFKPSPDPNGNVVADIPKQVAFVKCSVSEKIFMPPKTIKFDAPMCGQQIKDIKTKSKARKIYIPCSGLDTSGKNLIPGSGVFVDSFSYYIAHYVPTVDKSTSNITDFIRKTSVIQNSEVVQCDFTELDTNHVYALITLPGRISPTRDARLRDGIFQKANAETFKHLMCMDTVDVELDGFDKPPAPNGVMTNIIKTIDKDCNPSLADSKVNAWSAARAAKGSLCFGLPQLVNNSLPSPVYPDLVALPLMSKDRCYGPWVSSLLDEQAKLFSNIGGKIEYTKDENLAPWNYAGYSLLNEAGKIRAEFANSLLLFSERGGFSIPSAPSGVALGTALTNGGPIITNISIDVSDAGIKTTYKMDLYTSNFGKLQKQHQDKIAKMGRERQKLTDERNALIRKGLGKNAKRKNYLSDYNALSVRLPPQGLVSVQPMTHLCMSAIPHSVDSWSSQIPELSAAGPTTKPTPNHVANSWSIAASTQSLNTIASTAESFLDANSIATSYYNTGGASWSEMMRPVSYDSYHANLPYVYNPQVAAKSVLSKTEGMLYEESDITRYGAK